ncbi:MAG: RNA methyltransferase [Proteobacteria bacterium]|nr:RNA methyltransferase [Pseudomonadota bacterium]
MDLIESPQNERFMHVVRVATQPRYRREHRETWVEGLRLVEAALAAVAGPVSAARLLVLAAPIAKAPTPRQAALIDRAHQQMIPVLVLSDVLFRQVTQVEQAQGLGLIWSTKTDEKEGTDLPLNLPLKLPLNLPSEGLADGVLLDGVQDPGNVGSLLRTAAAAGVRWAMATKGTAELSSPKADTCCMEGHFSIALREGLSPEMVLHLMEASGVLPVAAVLADEASDQLMQSTRSVFESAPGHVLNERRPLVWVFGQEGSGVSQAILAWPTLHRVTIPQANAVESLNVAAAAAICLFERRRRWLIAQGAGY